MEARNGKRAILVSMLQQERGYVQAVADATPEDGATIIRSAGMDVRKTPARGSKGRSQPGRGKSPAR